jgi:glucose-6-phosphate 1-dehydrogenase
MAVSAAPRAERQIHGVVKPDDHVLVIFGATGDLARRKLLPGLFHLAETGLLPDGYRIVGASREDFSDDEFRDFARQAIDEFGAVFRWARPAARYLPRRVIFPSAGRGDNACL